MLMVPAVVAWGLEDLGWGCSSSLIGSSRHSTLLFLHSSPIRCNTFRSSRDFLVHRKRCEDYNVWELLLVQLLVQLLGQLLGQLLEKLLERAVRDQHYQQQFLRNSRIAQAWTSQGAEGTLVGFPGSTLEANCIHRIQYRGRNFLLRTPTEEERYPPSTQLEA